MQASFADDRPVARLCQGPLVTAAAGVLQGRTTGCRTPRWRPISRWPGATFQDGEAVVDGGSVSGRAWPDRPGWMREVIRLLRDHAPVEAETAGPTA